MTDSKAEVLIIDLGSQYTEVIRRSLRYLGFHSDIVSADLALAEIKENKDLKGLILSGGSASVYDPDVPKIPVEILNLNIPILGICLGMQWLAYKSDPNAVVAEASGKSYGPVEVTFTGASPLFAGLPEKINAWSSHGDSVKFAPGNFKVIATSKRGAVIEAMENLAEKIWAVQFHPEVEDTEDENKILYNFVADICGAKQNYKPEDIIAEIRQKVKAELGGGTAIIGVSGGVDSTTLAAILAPTLRGKLKAFMIDTGGMRKGEVEHVQTIAGSAGINLEIIEEYKNKFIKKIGQTINAEEKRAKFREVYKEVFQAIAKKYGATHVLQGTLATDLIESGSLGNSALIKTHHNVDLGLGLLEITPLADFFKFEVRTLARKCGLDELLANRQPFPGPGLYLRVIGIPVTLELLDMVREADHEVAEILKKHGLYDQISQVIVALLGVKTVGVKGDGRVYGYSFAVRTVATADFMTVKGFYLPPEVCEEIASTLGRHKDIVRVLFDWTPKPPATTEFE